MTVQGHITDEDADLVRAEHQALRLAALARVRRARVRAR